MRGTQKQDKDKTWLLTGYFCHFRTANYALRFLMDVLERHSLRIFIKSMLCDRTLSIV
jgi:undecaprenyl pyrophosphate phosphatase UppP